MRLEEEEGLGSGLKMADGMWKAPKKGILKSSSSFEKPEPYRCSGSSNTKEMKWDEMNILQTLHPPDKDYGHMKIEEPKTPFSHYKDPEDGNLNEIQEPKSDDETDGLDADLLAKKIQLGSDKLPKALEEDDDDDDSDNDPRYANETEEERAKRKMFEQKRKLHYNEFYAVKLARKLMEQETDEEEEEEEEENAGGAGDTKKKEENGSKSSDPDTKAMDDDHQMSDSSTRTSQNEGDESSDRNESASMTSL